MHNKGWQQRPDQQSEHNKIEPLLLMNEKNWDCGQAATGSVSKKLLDG